MQVQTARLPARTRAFLPARPQCDRKLRSNSTPATSVTTAPTAKASTVFHYSQLEFDTQPGISLFDVTPHIKERIRSLGVTEGFVNVVSRHTTTAIAINEYETRLLDDIRQVSRPV